MILALAGNQNSGKTTLFNQLTGSNQHVGNFPGVTVEQKSGTIRPHDERRHRHRHHGGQHGGHHGGPNDHRPPERVRDQETHRDVRPDRTITVVDLPGIYSIRPYSAEEIVTRDFILNEKPDGIINIVDATNIERNLYLTLQLIEMRVPMVLALNMMDEVRGNGGTIDIRKMSDELGIPVVPISAAKNEGIDELVETMTETARKRITPRRIDFCESGPVHRCIHAVSHIIEDHADKLGIAPRFAATKIIEGDEDIIARLEFDQNELELIEHSIVEMETEQGLDRNAAMAEMRYLFIEKVCAHTVVKCRESKEHSRSVKIDRLLTDKYLAIPVFLLIMFAIFWLTFDVFGRWLSDLLSLGITALTGLVNTGLTAYGINPVVKSLVIDGVFAGVGSMLSFLPLIVVLFFFLSILEDTGYMARVAYVMDKLMRKLGLSGRSIVPNADGLRLQRPRRHVRADAVLQPRPENDDPFDPVHELLGEDPHLRHLHRRVLHPVQSPRHDRALPPWHRHRHYRRACLQQNRLPGEAGALRHGAAELQVPVHEKCPAAPVGKRPRIFWSGPLRSSWWQRSSSGSCRPST